MWTLPGLGTEPGSPALAGGFLTTGPPGKLQTMSSSANSSAPFQGLLLACCWIWMETSCLTMDNQEMMTQDVHPKTDIVLPTKS